MSGAKIIEYFSYFLCFVGILVACSVPAYRILAIILVILAAMLYVFYRVFIGPSPWTIIETHRIVNIKKANGSLASATKNTTIRANQKGLTEFLHRNIRADGSIQNFKLGSRLVRKSDVEWRAGEYIIHERFPAMKRFEKRESSLSYELIKSFPSKVESTGYLPDYHTRKCKIEIYFPKRRSARNPRAYAGIGAETKNLNTPELSPDGRKISWEGKNLKPGKSYTVEWDW